MATGKISSVKIDITFFILVGMVLEFMILL